MNPALDAARRHYREGDLPRAEAAFREAVRLRPDDAEAWRLLGAVCRALGRPADAAAAFREAVRLRPDDAEALAGLTLSEQDRTRAAAAGVVTVEVAPGELIDKITILEIKSERLAEPAKLDQVRRELDALRRARAGAVPPSDVLTRLEAALKAVNATLWEVEDAIRACERDKDFGPRFVELARSVYRTNDARSALKRQINELLGAPFGEQKAYTEYA
jgi:tetratricopeptide (TPR) repeat protein